MTLDIPLSPEAEKRLRELASAARLDLSTCARELLERALESEAAKEAFIIEGYRAGRLSLGQIATLLSLSTRLEAERWLAERRVPLNYDIDDFDRDCETLGKLFPQYFPQHR
jgi:predicted HTH domain antitoxin